MHVHTHDTHALYIMNQYVLKTRIPDETMNIYINVCCFLGTRPSLPPILAISPCCSVWRCVAGCCSVLQWHLEDYPRHFTVLQCVAVCSRVLQCVAVALGRLSCPYNPSSPLHCVAVCTCTHARTLTHVHTHTHTHKHTRTHTPGNPWDRYDT